MSTHSASERLAHPAGPSRRRTVIKPTSGWAALRVREIWSFRELLYFLIWRDLKVRYRQTAFGVAWVLLQPLVLMVVIALFFGVVVDVPSEGKPYPVFVFTALLPWTLFSQSFMASSTSLLVNSNLISKIYFPRLLLPLAAAGSFLIDFLVGMVLLVVMMFIYGAEPTLAVVLLPVFTILCLVTALAAGTLLSATNVRYRDVQSAVPLLIQVWLFASPVAYPITLIPEGLRVLYGLNPMATVIGGFRWALLGTPAPSPGMVAVSVATALILFVIGVAYFRRTERTFADVI
jgi:homopolymeric O-antigen transport system permease protein